MCNYRLHLLWLLFISKVTFTYDKSMGKSHFCDNSSYPTHACTARFKQPRIIAHSNASYVKEQWARAAAPLTDCTVNGSSLHLVHSLLIYCTQLPDTIQRCENQWRHPWFQSRLDNKSRGINSPSPRQNTN